MKIYNYLTESLNRFRSRSLNHLMVFRWDGYNMKVYQNGNTFVLSRLFSGCIMPKSFIKGIIFPKDLKKFIEAQDFIDSNKEDIIISPAEWGYDIYRINKEKGNPLLVYELKFYSVKGKLPVFVAKWLMPKVRTALKNL